MSLIKILPEILSNKIAAGEVVERPAAVVKELVENALDAGATRILVEIENGGRSLIRVSDNGSGMPRDDALLAIERYATSKLADDADLFSIRTLGFRGEALPSIAAVSRFTLITRPKDADAGTGVYLEGGKLKKVADEGAPVGTMVSVRQLFFNIPVRRKFLKTTATEMGHITDAVATIALAWPDVQFRLQHNRKTIKNFSAADPALRTADVLGQDLLKALYEIAFNEDAVSISGWVSDPRVARSSAQGIYLFVNGRPVRDRTVLHGLMAGYERRLMKGQFPVAVLFIKVPFDRVDVNVHPTKNEVRFTDPNRVHDAVRTAVAAVLGRTGRPGWVTAPVVSAAGTKPPGLAEPMAVFRRQTPQSNSISIEPLKAADRTPPQDQPPLWEPEQLDNWQPIGQFRGTYILCEAGDELILIDQHAAHERIRFEQLKQQTNASRKSSQRLLIPQTIDLDQRQAAALSEILAGLQNIGLEIEPFGGSTFVVKAVPAVLAGREIEPLIREVAETLTETGFSAGIEKALEECLVVMACHGTLRANRPLSQKEMQHLVEALGRCNDPSHCPHGRPTWIKWNVRTIEKLFGRIV
ncbi:MAG: DNA mismatch repair endonuclease MutL [Desulfobacterales bacterium]|nr:DNA mismatch repair endonuclease MutL [Desulfobacterales bacterium]